LAARSTSQSSTVDASTISGLDVVDVVAVAATLVGGQLRALTADLPASLVPDVAAGVLARAGSRVTDARSVNAIATVVGAAAGGDRAIAHAIARAATAFSSDELGEAAIALVTATLEAIADSHGVDLSDVVRWSAGDPAQPMPAHQQHRVVFCGRTRRVAAQLR
jgi:hypothetical protein